jgi:signal transduction histidine kinase
MESLASPVGIAGRRHGMIRLSDWVDCHARTPLVLSIVLFIGVQAAYFAYLAYSRYLSEVERIERTRQSVSLGVQQSNRPLIESALAALLDGSDVAAAALCDGTKANVTYPATYEDPCLRPVRGIGGWSIRNALVGVVGQDMVVVTKPYSVFGPLLFLMVLAVSLLGAVARTLARVRGRFEREILQPLREGLDSDVPLWVAELEDLRRRNQEHARLIREQAASEAVLRLSAQVAHDIRSPLAALDSAIKDMSQVPEERRALVRSAVGRIRDIANSLLNKNRELKSMSNAGALTAAAEPATAQLLSSLIDPLVSEKRMQFRARPGVEIDACLDAASYGLFATVQPSEFKRVLSNLVNNSVEAMGDRGNVAVRLAPADGNVVLTVQDDAKGIPAEVLAKLGKRGVTHGKAGGSGLGLHHAKTSMEAWGGRLSLASEVGKGTTVTIELPKAPPPEWFVPILALHPGGTVVVLDDDASIHQVWRGRFDSAKVAGRGIEALHFSTPEQLRSFVSGSPAKAREALYLADYELAGHKETGLDLVAELGIGERTILVTSRSEEAGILAECRRLKVRMIPKGLAGFVPISIAPALQDMHRAEQDGPDAVLLDDDALVRMNWTGTAKVKGLRVLAFQDSQEFLAAAGGFPKETAIYLDSKLGDGMRGEDIAKDLHAKGFTNLYLTTGYERGSLPDMPWIREIVGKAPPWG